MKITINHLYYHASILLVLLFSGFLATAQTITIGKGKNQFDKIDSNTSSISYKNNIGVVNIHQIEKNNEVFHHISIPGYGTSIAPGEPSLPVFKKLISLPHNENYSVKIKSVKIESISLNSFGENRLLPAQKSAPLDENFSRKTHFEINESAYKQNKYISNDLVTITAAGTMRDIHIKCIELNPVQYYPIENKIDIYTEIEFEIVSKNSLEVNYDEKFYSPYFKPFYKSVDKDYNLVNSNPIIRYVIISDRLFEEALQPYIEWKTLKGFRVETYYTDDPQVGSDTASIRNFLYNLYINATPENPAPTFGLLVGDTQEIPVFPYRVNSYNDWFINHITDLHYFEYTGDFIPEVIYGRFSGNTIEEIETQVKKVLEYEKYDLESTNYLSEAMLCSGYDNSPVVRTYIDGYMHYLHNNYFTPENNIYSHTYYSDETQYYPTGLKIKIFEGLGMVNYFGHASGGYGFGTADFNDDDIHDMYNFGKYTMFIGHCCYPNDFDRNDVFGEMLLTEPNKAGIGFIGSSNAIWWDPSYWWGVGYRNNIVGEPEFDPNHLGAYDRLFHTKIDDEYGISTQGQILYAGNFAVEESGEHWKEYYWETFHLMGDPSLMPYLRIPDSINYNINTHVPVGNQIKIEAEPGLFISVTDYDLNIVETFIIDSTGSVNLTNLEIGDYKIVITGQNKIPVEKDLHIYDESNSFIKLENFQCIDDANNQVETLVINEEYSLDFTLKNLGLKNSEDIKVDILIDDEMFIVKEKDVYLSGLLSDETASYHKVFSLKLNEQINTGKTIQHFRLQITEKDRSHQYLLPVNVRYANIDFKLVEISEEYSGNNNGIIEQNELVQILIAGINYGQVASKNISGTLTCNNADVEIFNPEQIKNINIGGDEYFRYYALVPDNIQQGTRLEFQFRSNFLHHPEYLSVVKYVGNVIDFENPEDPETMPYLVNNSLFKWELTNKHAIDGFCYKTPIIGDNMVSQLKIMYPSGIIGDSISLSFLVMTEENNDIFEIKNNGDLIGQWSGDQDWQQVTIPFIEEGMQFILLTYTKNDSLAGRGDYVRIDNIVLPIVEDSAELVLVGSVFPHYNVCEGDTVTLMASAFYGTGEYNYYFSSDDATIESITDNRVISYPNNHSRYYISVSDDIESKSQIIDVSVGVNPEIPEIIFNDTVLTTNSDLSCIWYYNDTILAHQNISSIEPMAPGKYYVKQRNEFGCLSQPSNVILIKPEDDLIYDKDQILVYPNPISEMFNVVVPLNEEKNDIIFEIYGLDGQKVFQEKHQVDGQAYFAKQQNISGLSNGLYVVNVYVNGTKNSSRKIIVSK